MKLAPIFCLVLMTAWVDPSARADSLFEPPPDDDDWVQLTSGEWLKGELISLYDDELTFESEILDKLVIDLDDVKRFRGGSKLAVSVQGRGTKTGQIGIEGDRIRVMVDEEAMEFHREDLLAITPAAMRELDNWSGDLNLGLNIRSGNTEITDYSLITGLERRTPISRVSLDYIGNFSETDNVEVANSHRANLAWDRFTGRRLYWRPFSGQFFRDPFQNISAQYTAQTGFGYELVDTERAEWTFSGDLGLNVIRYGSVEEGAEQEERSPVVTLGTQFDIELTGWLDYLILFNMSFLDEDSGAYQHHLVSTLSTDLVGPFDLNFSVIWDRIKKPQVRADGTVPEQDDYRLLMGLGIDF